MTQEMMSVLSMVYPSSKSSSSVRCVENWFHMHSLCPEHERPQGYPALAEYTNSNEDYLVFRKFGYLRCRAILHCQEELAEFERVVECMDEKDHDLYDDSLLSVQIDEGRDKPH